MGLEVRPAFLDLRGHESGPRLATAMRSTVDLARMLTYGRLLVPQPRTASGCRFLVAFDPIPPSEFDPPEGSLRRSVGRGAVATAVAQAVQVALQVVSVLTLSRLLAPDDFGVVAMCAPVIALVAMLQNFGLVQATVQRKGLLRAEVNFLFWINVAASAALTLLLLALSPLVAVFYGDPRVASLMAALSVTILIGGLGAQHLALLNRRMAFGRLAAISMVSASTALAVQVAWAWVSPSYWALFAGTLASGVLATALTWRACGWWPSLPRRVASERELLGFGAGITGFNLTNFVARNLDNVLIGRVWGAAELGFYDRAYKLLLLPLQQIANPLSRVMIPALSRIDEQPDRYRHAFFRVLNLSALVSLPGVAFATALADEVIPLVLGEQWRQSAPIFMALGFAGLLQTLNNPAGWLFISQGRTGDYAFFGLVTAVMAVLAFLVGLPYGALGVAIAYAASEYLKTPLLWMFVARRGPIRLGDVIRNSGPMIVAAHGVLAGLYLARGYFGDGGVPGLVLAAASAYALFAATLLPFPAGRATLREAAELVMQLRRRAL